MKLNFSKYHGAGNDFIMIDNRDNDPGILKSLTPEVINSLCMDHLGIGADGVIIAEKNADSRVQYTMNYFNADGSQAEMCGNGLRCLVQFLVDLGEPVTAKSEIEILTGAGIVKCMFIDNNYIKVNMPLPSFKPADIKTSLTKTKKVSINVPGLKEKVTGTAVSIGNPHFVIYNTEMWEGDDIHTIGHRLEIYEDVFPEGVNVGFARKESVDSIALVVWERGVGVTLACGSGAVAAVAVGIAEGKFNFDQKITVRMPGGMLAVTIGKEWSSAVLEGEAVKVFDGEIELPS
ncbi:MAG: diaminopimelate epimerase [Candidatus Electryonea clarkiae]|nr:diaminopimelate epimerase [Candidatus Electryonea clarkiae]MDP8288921.1 diaminopimelate epimerase [Candidatus Electryonea clarkiae]